MTNRRINLKPSLDLVNNLKQRKPLVDTHSARKIERSSSPIALVTVEEINLQSIKAVKKIYKELPIRGRSQHLSFDFASPKMNKIVRKSIVVQDQKRNYSPSAKKLTNKYEGTSTARIDPSVFGVHSQEKSKAFDQQAIRIYQQKLPLIGLNLIRNSSTINSAELHQSFQNTTTTFQFASEPQSLPQ